MPRHLFSRLDSGAAGAALIVLVSVLALACNGGASEEEATPGGIVVKIPSPTAGQTTPRPKKTQAPTVMPSPSPLKVCGVNPDPASPSLLQIEEPKPEQQVKIPFHVRGWGSTIGFEDGGVALAIVNAKQEVVQVLDLPPQPRTYRSVPADLKITDDTRPFAADVVITNITEPTPFCLWVYQETTTSEPPTPKGVLQVPIVVLP